MNFRTQFLVMVSLVLSGCAVAYVQPTDPTSATLTLKNESKIVANFTTWEDGESCKSKTIRRITFDAQENWNAAPGQSFEVKVKPDQPFTLDASMFYHERVTCQNVLTFIPQKNASYVAVYNDNGRACFLSIRRVESGSGGSAPVLVKEASVRERVRILGGGEYGCK